MEGDRFTRLESRLHNINTQTHPELPLWAKVRQNHLSSPPSYPSTQESLFMSTQGLSLRQHRHLL